EVGGVKGVYFAVWAPAAKSLAVIGDFNHWQPENFTLHVRWDGSGIWEGFVPGVEKGALYKYKIFSDHNDKVTEKADPYSFYCEKPPRTASVVWELENQWADDSWMNSRHDFNSLDKPMSVYELHLGSWRRNANNEFLTYRELAPQLVSHIGEMGFTHVEFMPVMEFPYDPSWGYQITGYFAPTARFGTPQDFMFLVGELHKANIGVILDWVPSHFPSDEHGLGFFDGTHLYEHPDVRKGYHPDWKSLVFNYGRGEVRSFLISNAVFWMKHYHADALRVDAVASMLYLDYSRSEGEWEPNEFGGRENLDTITFLKDFNEAVYLNFEGVQTIAEESTSFPMVSHPTYAGGLGFGLKWMMGWMNDTLKYFQKEPIYRKYHQGDLTMSMTYAFSENFMLPLSHDEVVHGKGSLLGRMPGDEWQQFANLRLLYTFLFMHPGAKLLFQGAEFGQRAEWDFNAGLDWHLLDHHFHRGIQETVKRLNYVYRNNPALYELQFKAAGFEWINYSDSDNAVISFLRKGHHSDDDLLIVCNLTPVAHSEYRVGVPIAGNFLEIFNSDDEQFGGSGFGNTNLVTSDEIPWDGRPFSISLRLPPLAGIVFSIK
ncbi:MAG: 1,4-alpha-glucan branching protein GlgB, partial [Flavobacterium sp.]|nr:1,4-alpha-glucan branching protein GlgB [Flavobacterium sp.]